MRGSFRGSFSLGRNKFMSRQLLFCPGPINVALNVKKAVIENEIGHREPEFSYLLTGINEKLLRLYGQSNDKKYYPVVITGSGTAANEAILSSVIQEKSILVLANGEFGERLFNISKIHNKNTFILNFGWGQKIDLQELENYLKSKKVDFIAMVHHETSTGMLNPIIKVGKLAKKYGCFFIIDTVSSAGAEIVDIEKANVTFCSSSTGKAIGALPGLSFVVGLREAFEKLSKLPSKTMYLNLYKFYFYSQSLAQTPNTPAVQLFFALDQALTNVFSVGLHNRINTIHANAEKMRSRMRKIGLKFLINKEDMCSFLTTVLLPKNIQVATLKTVLRENNIVVYEGKGPLKGKVFQIGHVGELSDEEIDYCLEILGGLLANNSKKTISAISADNLILAQKLPVW